MAFESLTYETRQSIVILRLNRPRVLNAMNGAMWHELSLALADAASATEVKVVVITGEGRAFSTGADLKESKTRSAEDYRDYLENLQEISRRLIRFEKPTIAAINGYALGSGVELALACDIRLAATDAAIGFPEARVTSSVTGGATRLLQELVGPGKARELLFSAGSIDGLEAERIGLVNRAVAPERLMAETLAMAERIAQNSAFSIRMMKKGLFMAAGGIDLAALMDFEAAACLSCVSSLEREASLKAFEERKQQKGG
jgi:enoyl-CoA hydratase